MDGLRFSAVTRHSAEHGVRAAAALSLEQLRQAAHAANFGTALTPLLRAAHAHGEGLLAAVDTLIATEGFPLPGSAALLATTLKDAAGEAETLVDRVSPAGNATGARASDVDVLLRRAAERLVPERHKLGVWARSPAAEELADRMALLPAAAAVVVAESNAGTVLVCARMEDSSGRTRGTYKIALRIPGTPVTYVDRGPLHGELGFEQLCGAGGKLAQSASELARAIAVEHAAWLLGDDDKGAPPPPVSLVKLRAPVL